MTYKKGSKDPCKGEACAIQACLKQNNFIEEKCKGEIENLKKCCKVWFEKHRNTIDSDCCSGFIKEFERETKQKK